MFKKLRLADGRQFSRGIIVAGRAPECEWRFDSPRVSWQHAVCELMDEKLTVRDLGSTNGTRWNGHRIEKSDVRPGDVIAFGPVRYCFKDGGNGVLLAWKPDEEAEPAGLTTHRPLRRCTTRPWCH